MAAIATIPAAPGPRWTRKRLAAMLIDCYGAGHTGGFNAAAIARHCGVSPRTVLRWLSGDKAPNALPSIPRERLEQLQRAMPEVDLGEDQKYRYALRAVQNIAAGRVKPAWERQGWLSEHLVIIDPVPGKPWKQVRYIGSQSRAGRTLTTVPDPHQSMSVPTYFHAQALAHAVMLTVSAWRVHPHPDVLPKGGTKVWIADAPDVDLKALAAALFGDPPRKLRRPAVRRPRRR